MFIHDGPYAEAILRFTIHFELDFPKTRPVIKFGPDVYHRKSSLCSIVDDSYDRSQDASLVT
jgi:ubiquitin-protein ligase